MAGFEPAASSLPRKCSTLSYMGNSSPGIGDTRRRLLCFWNAKIRIFFGRQAILMLFFENMRSKG